MLSFKCAYRAKRRSRGIRVLTGQRTTDFAPAIAVQSRTCETSATASKEIHSARHRVASSEPVSETHIGVGGITSLFDTTMWIGNILQRMFSTTTGFITAILNQSGDLIESITGTTVAHGQRQLRFIGNCGSTTTAPSTGTSTFITKTETRSTTGFPISTQKTSASICPTTCASRSESLCRAEQSKRPKQQLRTGIALPKAANGTVNTLSGSSSASDGAQPVYNLLVEDAHEFFANDILVHNCDALVWLIQGLVEQGLDLPKIHWIEA